MLQTESEKGEQFLADTDVGFKQVISDEDLDELADYLHLEEVYPSRRDGIYYQTTKHAAVEALAHSTFKLKDKLASYKTVLSDDASGRLSGLYFLAQIKDEKKNLGQDSQTVFYGVASGNSAFPGQEEAVEKFIESKKAGLGKTLLVTEHISRGNGIIPLASFLKKEGVDFEIATVSTEKSFLESNQSHYSDEVWQWFKSKVIYGEKGKSGLYFYNRTENGLMKMQPLKNKFFAQAQLRGATSQLAINRSRVDMRDLGKEVLRKME